MDEQVAKKLEYKPYFQKQIKLKLIGDVLGLIVVVLLLVLPYVQRANVSKFIVFFPDETLVLNKTSVAKIIYEAFFGGEGFSLARVFDFEGDGIALISLFSLTMWFISIIIKMLSKLSSTLKNMKRMDVYVVDGYNSIEEKDDDIHPITYGFSQIKDVFESLFCCLTIFFTNYLLSFELNNGVGIEILLPVVLLLVAVVLQIKSAKYLSAIQDSIKQDLLTGEVEAS